MVKKIILFFVCIILVVSLIGCGFKKNIEEKVGEKITEGIINKVIGGEGKVDLDGDKITIKDKDGGELSIGGNEWPKDKAGKLLPEVKEGKITSVMNNDSMCGVVVEGIGDKDYKDYIEKLKDKGFTDASTEISGDNYEGFVANLAGTTGGLTTVTISYTPSSKELIISLMIGD